MKRVVVLSDLHSGHRSGLTPSQWQFKDTNEPSRAKFGEFQREVWSFYTDEIDSLKPIDTLVVNGDAVDGKGDKSGGTELITLDRLEQASIAAECILRAEAKKVVIIYGTPYHVGSSEDFEMAVAEKVDAVKVGGHEWIDINGVIFDFKHFVSSSTIPHGRYTSIARDALWNTLWASDGLQPKSDILIRSHVHYHRWAGEPGRLFMTTPALQGYGSKFGVRMCSGKIDIGFVSFDIESREDWTWRAHILKTNLLKQTALVL